MSSEKPSEEPIVRKLTVRDRMMLVNMALFLLVGLLILWRPIDLLSYGVGGVFLLLGGYRFYLFNAARRQWRPRSTPKD